MSVPALGRSSSRETRQNLCTRNGDADIETDQGTQRGKAGVGGEFRKLHWHIYTYCSWIAKSPPAPCDSIDCIMPSSSVLHYLPKFAQIRIRWVSDAVSSSVPLFSFHLQSLPASRSFSVSRLFTVGGQSTGVSASVLPMNIQDWFPLGWTGWISLQSKGLAKSLLQHHSSKASVLRCSAFLMVPLSHLCMTTGKS